MISEFIKHDLRINAGAKSHVSSCTGNDLKMLIGLIKHDLRINVGAKHM